MLLHRIVGVVGRGWRAIALAAAAPVDTDHADAAGKQRHRVLDPLLAGEVAVDEDEGDIALAPCAVSEMDVPGPHPRHVRSYLFRPTVGASCVENCCTGA